jgi:hypothetical protein
MSDNASQQTAAGSHLAFSPYRTFSREEWAKLRADTPMTLVPRELKQLSGLIEDLSVSEVELNSSVGPLKPISTNAHSGHGGVGAIQCCDLRSV